MFQGKEGNIPAKPIIVVVPVPLRDQWTHEIHKFLRRDGYDIFPYMGTFEKRSAFFSEKSPFSKSKVPPHRRIVLATTNVSHMSQSIATASPFNTLSTLLGYNYGLQSLLRVQEVRPSRVADTSWRDQASCSKNSIRPGMVVVLDRRSSLWTKLGLYLWGFASHSQTDVMYGGANRNAGQHQAIGRFLRHSKGYY